MNNKNRIVSTLLLAMPMMFLGCSGESPESLMSSAKKHLVQHEVPAAVIQLKNLLQKTPANAEARYLLGKALLESGDPVGAEVEVVKARELGFAEDKAVILLTQCLLAQGKAQAALDQFGKKKLASASANAELTGLMALAFAQLGKNDEMQSALQTALAEDPKNVASQLLLVKLQTHEKKLDEAGIALDKLIAQEPKNSEAWQLRGDLLLEKDPRSNDAVAAYRKALEFDGKNLRAHLSIIWLALNRNDKAAAKQQIDALVKVLPNHPETRFFVGLMALDSGDLKTAQEQSQYMLKVAPDSLRTLQLAGAVEYQRQAYSVAETYLVKFLKVRHFRCKGKAACCLQKYIWEMAMRTK